MRRLLSDPLPLRRSIVWSSYVADQVLPWVYGRVTLAPVPLDAAGLEWLVADHPVVGVTKVTVGGLEVQGWALTQVVDETGHPIAKIRLSAAPKDGADVAVTLIGRRHPDTGAAIEHPADICESLLDLCGWSVGAEALEALRIAWPALALGGVIDSETTLRAAVADIMANCGASWSASPLQAWVDSGEPVATVSAVELDSLDAESSHDALATRLSVTYGRDWAAGQPRFSAMLEAPDALDAYGEIEASLDLPWVRLARDAVAIGEAYLARAARPQWSISLAVSADILWAPGDAVDVQHPWGPRGVATVSRVTRSETNNRVSLIRPAGPVPRIELVRRGSLTERQGVEPLSVIYSDGIATFTILNDLGDPLAGASATLDESDTRTTDRNGQVQFKTTRGAHTLLVVANGYAPFEMEVQV